MDLEAKKKLLRAIPSGLYVAGVGCGEDLHAFTLSWVSQVSMKPPLVMLGVREDTYSLELLEKHRALVINYIQKDHKDTIEHFFKPASKEGGRLGGYPYKTGKTGAPILDEAIGYLECKVLQVVKGLGDHAPVIVEVVDAVQRSDAPPIILSDTTWNYGG